MLVRAEVDSDRDYVYSLNEEAFGGSAESVLVDRLRAEVEPIISLVAEVGGDVVGHIMFSPVILVGFPDIRIMGLAPMAVAPGLQRKGIGSALVRAGMDECRAQGVVALVVLGHPEYYPRFGFLPSSQFGIKSEYEVLEEVFMVMELHPAALAGKGGTVRYDRVFASL